MVHLRGKEQSGSREHTRWGIWLGGQQDGDGNRSGCHEAAKGVLWTTRLPPAEPAATAVVRVARATRARLTVAVRIFYSDHMFGSLSVDGMSQMPHGACQLPPVERRVWRHVAVLVQRSTALDEEDIEDGPARRFIMLLTNAKCKPTIIISKHFGGAAAARRRDEVLLHFGQENWYDLVQVRIFGRGHHIQILLSRGPLETKQKLSKGMLLGP